MKDLQRFKVDMRPREARDGGATSAPPHLSRFFIGRTWSAPQWLPAGLAIFFIVALISSAVGFTYRFTYADAFFSGSRVAGIPVGGLTFEEALQRVNERVDAYLAHGVAVRYNDQSFTLYPTLTAPMPDVPAVDLYRIDTHAALQRAFAHGRNGSALRNAYNQLRIAAVSPSYPLVVTVNGDELRSALQEQFGTLEKPARSASFASEAGRLTITNEQHGAVFNYDAIIQDVTSRIATLDSAPVTLSLRTDYPAVTGEELQRIQPAAESVLAAAPFGVTATSTNASTTAAWEITRATLVSLIGAQQDERTSDGVRLGLKRDETTRWLQETVAPRVEVVPQNAKFAVTEGKVTEFATAHTGKELDTEATIQALETLMNEVAGAASAQRQVAAVVVDVPSAITNENVNDLGISEIIGTGHSNFAGSPANRRHNIATGAAAVNGTLIAPDEEFSLLRTLGAIDKSTGYLPELVIKGNRTTPEYGGGLCQIGTTVFRGSLASGLPITERRNHSYRVSYYEPAGTDATIYDPAPDFKFKNDTGHYILIQSRIEGNDLYFDFWGTKDGRTVVQTKPAITKIVPPPPRQVIETDTLKPGETKCTEKAHSGADASFTYTVTYADGTKAEKTFFSRYRPWGEVCLVGKAATPEPTPPADGSAVPPADAAPATQPTVPLTPAPLDTQGNTTP